jgi:chromate transporter
LALYIAFFKVGLFAVGGGLATLPFIYDLAGRWPLEALLAASIPDKLAVAQLLPGAVGINLSGYVGAEVSALAAEGVRLGIITPQSAVMSAVTRFYSRVKESSVVRRVFAGLAPAAAGLLCAAGFRIWKLGLWDGGVKPLSVVIFVGAFVVLRYVKRVPIAVVIAAAGALGVALEL